MSGPLSKDCRRARGHQHRFAPLIAVALRPVLTATVRGAFAKVSRDAETPPGRTQKRHNTAANGGRG